ncbi:hypothetical protein ACFLVM_02655 [Chloroflexota bacterium]
MKQNTYRYKVVWRLVITLILAVSLLPVGAPAAAQSVEEYFELSFDPVSFSKTEINGSEAFNITIRGRATCTQDLPMPASEASFTSHVIAEHTVSGTRVTLNPSYTVTIEPFPSKKGDTTEINQDVPLQFPAQAESGDYNVIGELIEAEVKVAFVWIPVTDYLPPKQVMGSLKFTATESSHVPIPAPEPVPAFTTEPAPIPDSPGRGMDWWWWLIVAIALITTIVNIIWFLRHRTV